MFIGCESTDHRPNEDRMTILAILAGVIAMCEITLNWKVFYPSILSEMPSSISNPNPHSSPI
jgi:hypothetical protein